MNCIEEKLEVYKAVTHPGSLKILITLSRAPAGFTEIMFESKLSPSVLNKLLKSLTSYGIVVRNNGGKYMISAKGEKVFNVLLKIIKII